jgi:hypothetical protein
MAPLYSSGEAAINPRLAQGSSKETLKCNAAAASLSNAVTTVRSVTGRAGATVSHNW